MARYQTDSISSDLDVNIESIWLSYSRYAAGQFSISPGLFFESIR